MGKKITTVIFDLDGTLLNTLEDLADSTNYALKQHGFPERTLEEIRRFVGNGVRVLMERAVPEGTLNPDFEDVFACFKEYYVAHCQVKTGLYAGVENLLQRLKQKNYKLAIVSNKLQSGVDELYVRYFSDTVQVAIGERPEVRRKPAPDMVYRALQELRTRVEEAIYIGDSEVDLETARQAGLPCVSVSWGFRNREFLRQHGADCLVDRPEDILELLERKFG